MRPWIRKCFISYRKNLRPYILIIQWGTQNPQNLFIKSCVFILTCLNFSHLQSTLHVMQYTYWDVFSATQSSFWTHQFWCLSVLLLFFVPPLQHWQNVSLWGHFLSGEIKKSHSGQDWVNREGGAWGQKIFFGQKLLNTQHGLGRYAHKSPIMKWANALKESSKIIHWGQTQPLTTTAAGTLTQMGSWNTNLVGKACTTRGPPSRRSFRFWGVPPRTSLNTTPEVIYKSIVL